VHPVVWRCCFGVIPDGLEVDELCEVTLYVRRDHLDLKTKRANVKWCGQRAARTNAADGARV